MKAATYSLFTFLAIGTVAAAPAFAQATAPASDSTLDSRIESRINHDPVLKHYDVDVSVAHGIAKLTGKVRSEAARTKAGVLANVKGISKVDNQIVVDAHAVRSAAKATSGTISTKTHEAGEKTKNAVGKATDKTANAVSKTGEVITDGWITTRVKSKFVDEKLLKDSDIHVETNDHVVSLTGTVPSAAGRARAVEQAKEVEGVHKVVDHLTIGVKK
jgi:hyperosmotically inducible periplasmic protein